MDYFTSDLPRSPLSPNSTTFDTTSLSTSTSSTSSLQGPFELSNNSVFQEITTFHSTTTKTKNNTKQRVNEKDGPRPYLSPYWKEKTTDYRVSRVAILCKDCQEDVGFYPARHVCPSSTTFTSTTLTLSSTSQNPTMLSSDTSLSEKSISTQQKEPSSFHNLSFSPSWWQRISGVSSRKSFQETSNEPPPISKSASFYSFSSPPPSSQTQPQTTTSNTDSSSSYLKNQINTKENCAQDIQSSSNWGTLWKKLKTSIKVTSKSSDKDDSSSIQPNDTPSTSSSNDNDASATLREYYVRKEGPIPDILKPRSIVRPDDALLQRFEQQHYQLTKQNAGVL